MCSPPVKDALIKSLAKGSFPLLDTAGVEQWRCLLDLLKKDLDGTIKDVQKLPASTPLFGDSFTTGGTTLHSGLAPGAAFLGNAHAYLCRDFSRASVDPVQKLVQRARKIVSDNGYVKASKVALTPDPNTKMGTGVVANPLTFQPDPALGVSFGTQPDQEVIGVKAPMWKTLKRRAYETRPPLTQYGGKPHYVLAHLINHNINGSGADPLNVVPFWAYANTEMERAAEGKLKELVQHGFEVSYKIALGPAVGMSPARAQLLKDIPKMGKNDAPKGDRAVQAEIVRLEQYLPQHLVIDLSAKTTVGWTTVVSGARIDNYVPETVPYLRPAKK